MAYLDVQLVIASGGTTSGVAVVPAGYRLQSLEVPTIDNATLALEVALDGSTWRTPYDATGSIGQVQGASTGNRVVVLADGLSRATEGRSVRLVAGAAQAGGQRVVVGRCVTAEG